MITSTKAKPLLEQALISRNIKQNLIASNISNIDTPFFKARDMDFQTALKIEKSKLYKNDTQKLSLAKTNAKHLSFYDGFDNTKSTFFLRDGHMARNDGNTVDLDIETTELSKNYVMYNLISSTLSKSGRIFKSVLEASSKT